MEKPPLKAFGRSLSDFEPLFDNYPAERWLLEKCRSGEPAIISAQIPEQATKENTIRVAFLRFLALGGDEYAPVDEKGVRLYGAWVEDNLDLEGAILPHSLVLPHCHLSNISLLESNVYGFVSFEGCHIKGLHADRMACSGSVFLKNGFTTTGKVSLIGAQIGGDLECHGGKFYGNNGNALICDRAVIKGGVFLRDGFTATDTVRLSGVKIDGNLECDGGKFNGKGSNALIFDCAVIKGNVLLRDGFVAIGSVFLSGAQIGGNLECIGATLDGVNGRALMAESTIVSGVFFFRELVSVIGTVSLFAAKVGSMFDDNQSWTKGKLSLDGFIYDRLAGNAPTDAESRLKWLDKQIPSLAGLDGTGGNFKPQPWQQLQKVLYDMGHFEDTRLVAIAFQDRRREANLVGQSPENRNKILAWMYLKISRGLHRLYGVLLCYGHYTPSRLLIEMLIVCLACGAFYSYAAYEGVFAPSNPLVFQNPEYDACKSEILEFECTSNKNWYLCEKLPEEYTGFSPFLYSLDLILPLVDLQQEHDWSPMIPTPKNTWFGELKSWEFPKHCTRLLMWIEILFGWVYSLLLVAVVSGLTKRREE